MCSLKQLKYIYIYLFIGLFWVLAVACGIQFSDQGSNLGPQHWEQGSLSHWTTRKVPLEIIWKWFSGEGEFQEAKDKLPVFLGPNLGSHIVPFVSYSTGQSSQKPSQVQGRERGPQFLFLVALGLRCCKGFLPLCRQGLVSSCSAGLTVVASLFVEHGL